MLVTVGIVTQQEHLLVPDYRTGLVSSPYEGDKFRAENVRTLLKGSFMMTLTHLFFGDVLFWKGLDHLRQGWWSAFIRHLGMSS